MSVASKITEVNATLPAGTRLVAVSKYHPVEAIREAYEAGQRLFGESHVQEVVAKQEALPKDIEWHFIGHLQTNKVKYIVPFVTLIHSVDTLKLLEEIEKQAEKSQRTVNCLLELHIAQENTKFGFTIDSLRQLMQQKAFDQYGHICFKGLMCMATHTDNEEEIRAEFHSISTFFAECKNYMADFTELSMGMSNDYKIAITEGSTLVRVGTYIFGERDYSKKQ